MYAQVDDEGNMFQLLLEIMDHKKDGTAIDISNGMVTSANGNTKPKIMMQGWMLLVMYFHCVLALLHHEVCVISLSGIKRQFQFCPCVGNNWEPAGKKQKSRTLTPKICNATTFLQHFYTTTGIHGG
jgi:hypothetical protein